jgi:cytoplasmic iron level regulating protein YaaA (DUF328/UPF0246 family)
MLIVLSPAKKLDFTPPPFDLPATAPQFVNDTTELAGVTRKLKPRDLSRLMSISETLADLNFQRFQAFQPQGADEGELQAVLAFNGDVYNGLAARTLKPDDLAWAQDHLRILSGLYGLLRPLDRIQPYRLEMGVRLKTKRGATLHDFWGPRLAQALNAAAEGQADPTLVNLASGEYFGSVDVKALTIPHLDIRFLDVKDGKARVQFLFAKQARGMMARYAIEHRIDRAEGLKDFDSGGYKFDAKASTAGEWTFSRKQPPPPRKR